MTTNPIKAGDVVNILPEYQDEGDNAYTWIAVDDERDGIVKIAPQGITTGSLQPYTVVDRAMLA